MSTAVCIFQGGPRNASYTMPRLSEMDRQHQILFDLGNRLHEAMLLGKGKEILGPILAQVKTHMSAHCAHEEKLMKDTHYREYREHIQEHEELANTARFLSERFQCGETTMTIELALFLSSSVKQHILTTDRRLTEYLNTR